MQQDNEYDGVFSSCSDYKSKLHEIIDDLYYEVKSHPISYTIEKVRKVTDAYVEEVGVRPDVISLDRMATLILNEEITDTFPDKMSRDEFPIMSDTQREERLKDEVSSVWADEIGSDGVDYRPRTRDNNRKMRSALRL